MSTREERLANNQALFRAANEAIVKNLSERAVPRTLICECGDEGCMTAIRLTFGEYKRVRANRRHFALARGHEGPGDVVLEERREYTLVEKVGDAALVAERDSSS